MRKREIVELMRLSSELRKLKPMLRLEDYDFPSIDAIGEEIETLKREKKEVKEKYSQILDLLKSKICTHQVRLTYPVAFGTVCECVLCGERINGDNILNGTIYNDANRNHYYASFDGTYEDEDIGLVKGVDEDTIYRYINQILTDKVDDEEVDLVQEMKKTNISECSVIEKPFKKEYYVLIIGGSNKKMISNGSYMTSSSQDISLYLAYYFSGLPNTNVEIIDNPQAFKSNEFNKYFPYGQSSSMKCVSYETIQGLMKEINSLSTFCPFNLIIDVSNLNNYEIGNNAVNIKPVNLDFESSFPTSHVIRFTQFNNSYKKEWYYLDRNEEKAIIGSKELDEVCDDIKKLLLR